MLLSLCACGGTNQKSNDDSSKESSKETTSDNKEVATENEEESNAGKPISVGDTISLDCIDLTIDAYEISDGYDFEAKDGFVTKISHIDCSPGMKLVCLKGKVTNKTTSAVYTSNNPISGMLKINGYEYKTKMDCYIAATADRVYELVPMLEVDCFIYAEIPETLLDNIEACQLSLGIMENLDSMKTAMAEDLSSFDFKYVLEGTPSAQ